MEGFTQGTIRKSRHHPCLFNTFDACWILCLFLSITTSTPALADDHEARKNLSSYMEDIQEDYRFHYTMGKMLQLGLTLGVGGIMANTNIDHQFRYYYQDDIRSGTSDDIADIFTFVGDSGHMLFSVPIYLGAMLIGKRNHEYRAYGKLHDWGWRSIRTLALGAPQHYLLTHALGSGRPEKEDSSWIFFDDNNGVSGHTFYGAVPLINAANLAENKPLKYTLYTASVFPGLARINDDKHYLSQVVIGWMLAYMAADSAMKNDEGISTRYRLTPMMSSRGLGICIAGLLD